MAPIYSKQIAVQKKLSASGSALENASHQSRFFRCAIVLVTGILMMIFDQVEIGLSSNHGPSVISVNLGVSNAVAQRNRRGAGRRTARRTARRTTRRVIRRAHIRDCSRYRSYYNCSGVYYRPVVENGATVYVVVNP